MGSVDIQRRQPLTSSSETRDEKIRMLHEAMNDKLRVMTLAGELFKMQSKFGSNCVWNCISLILSYCRDVPEGKDISAVKHVLTVQQSCLRSVTTLTGIWALRNPHPRCFLQTVAVHGQSNGVEPNDEIVSLATRDNEIVLRCVEAVYRL